MADIAVNPISLVLGLMIFGTGGFLLGHRRGIIDGFQFAAARIVRTCLEHDIDPEKFLYNRRDK